MRILIVDDDPRACDVLINLCRQDPQAADAVAVGSGAAAIEAIRGSAPDLVLLNVELGDMSGFDVLRSLDPGSSPPVMLVTGHDEHALRAFEIGAIDYLMKPIVPERFETAMARFRSWQTGRVKIDTQHRAQSTPARLVAEKGKRLHFLLVDDIDYIVADGNYVIIYAGGSNYLRRDSLKHLVTKLEPRGFTRIRRNTLINLNKVAFAERQPQATIVFTMLSGSRLTSRSGFRLQGIE